MDLRVASLYRYPVKGLSPERLARADLVKGCYFPADRLFAVENGPSGFDAAVPQHQPKIKFLMLMRNEALARLTTRYDDAATTLTIEEGGREVARGDLSRADGRLAIEAFFRRFMPRELRGAPKVLAAPDGFRFTDSRRGFVSIINLASIQAIEEMAGAPVDPLRFRGNIHIEGLAPWREFDLVGQGSERTVGRAPQGDEAYRALRGHQRRSRHRSARPCHSEAADEPPRSRRLRRLRGGVERRQHRRGRAAHL